MACMKLGNKNLHWVENVLDNRIKFIYNYIDIKLSFL